MSLSGLQMKPIREANTDVSLLEKEALTFASLL